MKKPKLKNSKALGELTEQIVIAELMKKGFTVLKPIGDNCRYDLLIDMKGKFLRLQTKTSRYSNGCILFKTSNARINTKKNYNTFYDKNQIDMFAVYSYETEKVYLIPIKIKTKYNFSLRTEECKNRQQKNIKFAKDYELQAFGSMDRA